MCTSRDTKNHPHHPCINIRDKKFSTPPSAAKSDFGKFTTDDPRSTNEEDPEAWRRRKGVHLEMRKITLRDKKIFDPHQQRSRISENSTLMTPGAPMRRILKPGGGEKGYISRSETSALFHVSTLEKRKLLTLSKKSELKEITYDQNTTTANSLKL